MGSVKPEADKNVRFENVGKSQTDILVQCR